MAIYLLLPPSKVVMERTSVHLYSMLVVFVVETTALAVAATEFLRLDGPKIAAVMVYAVMHCAHAAHHGLE